MSYCVSTSSEGLAIRLFRAGPGRAYVSDLPYGCSSWFGSLDIAAVLPLRPSPYDFAWCTTFMYGDIPRLPRSQLTVELMTVVRPSSYILVTFSGGNKLPQLLKTSLVLRENVSCPLQAPIWYFGGLVLSSWYFLSVQSWPENTVLTRSSWWIPVLHTASFASLYCTC